MTDLYVFKDDQTCGPLTVTEAAYAFSLGWINADDHVRRGEEGSWKAADRVQWPVIDPTSIHPDDRQQIADVLGVRVRSTPPITTRTRVRTNARTQPKPSRGGGAKWAVLFAALLVIGAGAGGYIYWQASPQGQPAAERYLTEQLDAWKAGRPSYAISRRAGEDYNVPLLVDYEVVEVTRIDRDDPPAWDAVINLTFSTAIGGRPVEQRRMRLVRQEDGYLIERPYYGF